MRFNDILEELRPPRFGEEELSDIDPNTYLPEYHGRAFVELSSPGLATLVKLLRVHRVDRKASFHQTLHHRSSRRLDRHADLARLAGLTRGEGQQPVRHLRQTLAAMLERPFPEHLPDGVEHTRLMLLRTSEIPSFSHIAKPAAYCIT